MQDDIEEEGIGEEDPLALPLKITVSYHLTYYISFRIYNNKWWLGVTIIIIHYSCTYNPMNIENI